MEFKHIVKRVESGSIAEEMEIEAGDEIVSINGKKIEDIFDYQYFTEDEHILVLVRKKNGEEWELEIDKDEDEDLGIEFENGLMDNYRSCHNKCIFCFIDQMPKGMRESLYFKDDDSRLSFLQGNYITLTNMSEHDIDRIIKYRLGPINISFQTTNPELRCKMLNNRFAGEALKKVDRLFEAGISMNGQIVLCKGVNDGRELERSISDLSKYIPCLESVSVVPVGLSRFRDGLYPLEPFTKEEAKEVLKTIHSWQDKIYAEHGTHFIHAGDELYFLAEEPIPEADSYDGYIQYENGVGMVRSFIDEFEEELEGRAADASIRREISLVGGMIMKRTKDELLAKLNKKFPNIAVHNYAIRNDFFGERITVTGLLTGKDILAQLEGQPLGEMLYLPVNLLRSGSETLLDDITVSDISRALQVPVDIVESDGRDFVRKIVGD